MGWGRDTGAFSRNTYIGQSNAPGRPCEGRKFFWRRDAAGPDIAAE